VMMYRDDLIRQIKAGKRFSSGTRKTFLASTFELKDSIRVNTSGGKDYLALTDKVSVFDDLTGLPVI
jgi:hypothetical protein